MELEKWRKEDFAPDSNDCEEHHCQKTFYSGAWFCPICRARLRLTALLHDLREGKSSNYRQTEHLIDPRISERRRNDERKDDLLRSAENEISAILDWVL